VIEAGGVPGLRTEGTGTDSATCPLIGVGNLTGPGVYPPKYLDAFMDKVEIGPVAANWISVARGESLSVQHQAPLSARVTVTNLGEAALLCPQEAAGRAGAVWVTVSGPREGKIALPKTLKRFETIVIEVPLSDSPITADQAVEIGLCAENRIAFGPRYRVRLTP